MTATIQNFYYDELDSTQDEAKRLLKAGKITDVAYIVAEHQTKGRGTRGRTWSSPKGGIYLSIVHLPKKNEYLKSTTAYTTACGVACIEAIKESIDIKCNLKLVNDIYFSGKKLGGILVESMLYQQGISSLITGVGININKVNDEIDGSSIEPISLEEIMAQDSFKAFDKLELIKKLVIEICHWYLKVFNQENELVKEQWDKYAISKAF